MTDAVIAILRVRGEQRWFPVTYVPETQDEDGIHRPEITLSPEGHQSQQEAVERAREVVRLRKSLGVRTRTAFARPISWDGGFRKPRAIFKREGRKVIPVKV